MTYFELKKILETLSDVQFLLPDHSLIPSHFHVTEMGFITKNYIDCGNKIRQENKVTFQIWSAEDYEHRLTSSKFLKILNASDPLILDSNAEIEVEYQTEISMSKFSLNFTEQKFKLLPMYTTCLASNHCGIPESKIKISLKDLASQNTCCQPNTACC